MAKSARHNRKSSAKYASRAGANEKLGARRHYGQWQSAQMSARVGARIGADPQTGKRPDATDEANRKLMDNKPDARCALCHDPITPRDRFGMHGGCATRKVRRDKKLGARNAALRAAQLAAQAREVRQASPVGWTPDDLDQMAKQVEQMHDAKESVE